LAVIVLQVPTVAGVAVVFQDDVSAPSFSKTRLVSTIYPVGVAGLLQPKADTLRVQVPKTVTVHDAYVMAFDGPFLGSTLPP
jgi:hypothetical protein